MTTTPKRRTQVEALDALTAEVRTANLIAALALGPSGLDDDTRTKATTDESRTRLRRKNQMRAEVRTALGLGDPS